MTEAVTATAAGQMKRAKSCLMETPDMCIKRGRTFADSCQSLPSTVLTHTYPTLFSAEALLSPSHQSVQWVCRLSFSTVFSFTHPPSGPFHLNIQRDGLIGWDAIPSYMSDVPSNLSHHLSRTQSPPCRQRNSSGASATKLNGLNPEVTSTPCQLSPFAG